MDARPRRGASMTARRVIACLDVQAGRVVKGTRFRDLRDAGDPVELAVRYCEDGADELVLLDISASREGRAALFDVTQRVARAVQIPFTVGGGLGSVDDLLRALDAGADKVTMNTAIALRPELIAAAAERAGSQAVVAAIDALRGGGGWGVRTHGGTMPTTLDAVAWARRVAELGAGEILLTSMDRDGTRSGYDLELLACVSTAVRVPVVASGGAGTVEHLADAFTIGCADAVLVAGILHDGAVGMRELKRRLADHNIHVRP